MVTIFRNATHTVVVIGVIFSCGRLAAADEEYVFPKIKGYGKVVQLPLAVEQPRDGAKICVDVTAKGEPSELNPAIEKVARFVNIFAGAGQRPATAKITVVLHGGATLSCLNHEAYARRFGIQQNPNVALMAELRKHGVEFLVCGQALAGSGADLKSVSNEVKVAVSALTVNVNRQLDGYAFIALP